MVTPVMPLHYITVQFWLTAENQENWDLETSGQRRFLYGVETWIEGVDQQLESLSEGDSLELILESEAASLVLFQLLNQDEFRRVEQRMALELKIVNVVKAEPREVTKTLAAQVKCCDNCGSH